MGRLVPYEPTEWKKDERDAEKGAKKISRLKRRRDKMKRVLVTMKVTDCTVIILFMILCLTPIFIINIPLFLISYRIVPT